MSLVFKILDEEINCIEDFNKKYVILIRKDYEEFAKKYEEEKIRLQDLTQDLTAVASSLCEQFGQVAEANERLHKTLNKPWWKFLI